MAENRVKYFRHPTFRESEWEARNPYLQIGWIGFALDNAGLYGYPRKYKVGPGYWNDLPYFSTDLWADSTPVISPIGDAQGDLSGKSSIEILDLMLNPYVAPAISSVSNNAAGGFATTSIKEVGQTLPGPVLVNFSVSNQGNLSGANPITVDASGIFSNEGSKPVGQVSLTLASPLTPTGLTTVAISLTAAHQQGTTSPVYTYIKFYPRILWGVSPNATLTPGDWLTLTASQSVITDDYEKDYNFNATGYSWLAIPAMLSVGNLIFTDVTDPNAPAGYGITAMGQQTINNGVGSYVYQTYRSTFNLTTTSILRVRDA